MQLNFSPSQVRKYAGKLDGIAQKQRDVANNLRRMTPPSMPPQARQYVSVQLIDIANDIGQVHAAIAGHRLELRARADRIDGGRHDLPKLSRWTRFWLAAPVDEFVATGDFFGVNVLHYAIEGEWGKAAEQGGAFALNFVPIGKIGKLRGPAGAAAGKVTTAGKWGAGKVRPLAAGAFRGGGRLLDTAATGGRVIAQAGWAGGRRAAGAMGSRFKWLHPRSPTGGVPWYAASTIRTGPDATGGLIDAALTVDWHVAVMQYDYVVARGSIAAKAVLDRAVAFGHRLGDRIPVLQPGRPASPAVVMGETIGPRPAVPPPQAMPRLPAGPRGQETWHPRFAERRMRPMAAASAPPQGPVRAGPLRSVAMGAQWHLDALRSGAGRAAGRAGIAPSGALVWGAGQTIRYGWLRDAVAGDAQSQEGSQA